MGRGRGCVSLLQLRPSSLIDVFIVKSILSVLYSSGLAGNLQAVSGSFRHFQTVLRSFKQLEEFQAVRGVSSRFKFPF